MPVRRIRESIHKHISDRMKKHREREYRRFSSPSGWNKKKKKR